LLHVLLLLLLLLLLQHQQQQHQQPDPQPTPASWRRHRGQTPLGKRRLAAATRRASASAREAGHDAAWLEQHGYVAKC
jgi:hypothetical protein